MKSKNIKLYDANKMYHTQKKIEILDKVIFHLFKFLLRLAIAWVPVLIYLFFKYEGPVLKPITQLDMNLHIYVFVMFGISALIILSISIMVMRINELKENFEYYKGGVYL